MTPDPPTRANILIASGGRRNYLVNWFRSAVARQGLDVRVVVTDTNPYAPALADADVAVVVPPIDDPDYESAMRRAFEDHDIGLALSLNDYEISRWASQPIEVDPGIAVIRPSETVQDVIEDKYAYGRAFNGAAVATPPTLLASEIGAHPFPDHEHVVLKNRFGSGSHGLVRCAGADLPRHLEAAAAVARDRDGHRARSVEDGMAALVVQPLIDGQEVGLDVVHDLSGTYQGCLARRKLSMRAGETDQAITLESAQFDALARSIGSATEHHGIIDTDLILDPSGQAWLIDVNPRFGGGYPFSHMAGADVPACLVAWMTARTFDPAWLNPKAGVASSKTEDLRLVGP